MTKKMLTIRKMPRHRWQGQTHHPMSNRKQILKGQCGGGPLLLWPAPCRLRRLLLATFSNDSLEYTINRRRRRRQHQHHLTAGVEHDERPIRIIAAGAISNSASDRSTFSVL